MLASICISFGGQADATVIYTDLDPDLVLGGGAEINIDPSMLTAPTTSF